LEQKRRPNPRRPKRARYDTASYRRAVRRACRKGRGKRAVELYRGADITLRQAHQRAARDVPLWSPPQLRHTAATRIRKRHGIEMARVILGHSTAFTTEIYAETDRQKAMEVVSAMG
jgi:integrase